MLINKTSKVKITFAAICGVFAVFLVWKAESSQIRVPSDSKLLRIFQVHRDEFERLRQMATEDMHQTSYFSESKISNLLPEARRIEYKELLGLYRGLAMGINYDGSVRFIFADTGQAIGPGSAKGIQFVPDEAKLIGTRMDTLDGLQRRPAGVYLRQIEPRWFLFFQRDE